MSAQCLCLCCWRPQHQPLLTLLFLLYLDWTSWPSLVDIYAKLSLAPVGTRQSQQQLPPMASDPVMDVHPMKAFLDKGKLSRRSRVREFTTFLDLQIGFHNGFLARLENHVREDGYSWKDMLEQEQELRSCARTFVREFGREYWGTEEGRQKYLMEESLKVPETLTMYPARKDEIIRAVILLLEKKAHNAIYGHKKSKRAKRNTDEFLIPSPMPQRPESPTFTLYDTSSPIRNNQSFPIYYEKSDRKAKRKAYDIFETPPHEPVGISAFAGGQWTGSSKEIKPFNSVASLGDPPKRPIFEPRDMTPTPVLGDAELLDEPMTLCTPDTKEPQSIPVESNIPKEETNTYHPSARTAHDDYHNQTEYSYYYGPAKTTFLVTSSSQPDMGPVWVPFREFGSASSFLSYMTGECHPEAWDLRMQLNNNTKKMTSWTGIRTTTTTNPAAAAPASAPSVPEIPDMIAATVKFEWSGSAIRVRRGKDQDWGIVMRELQKSWAAAASSSTALLLSQMPQHRNPSPQSDSQDDKGQHEKGEAGFNIDVLLHAVG